MFTADEFDSMTAAGILAKDDRLELIEGEIFEMSPIGSLHSGCVNRLTRELSTQDERWVLSVQNSIRLNDFNQPQPDIMLLKYRDDFYSRAIPQPHDVLLLIEVSDTTLDYDRDLKSALYAKAGIPEYLIADLGTETLLAFCDPGGDKYETVVILSRGAIFESRAAGVPLKVDSVFG